jgi:hypothetical protein
LAKIRALIGRPDEHIFNNWFCGVVGYHFCLTHRRS